ncbi:hypothetical protein [Pseudarthrobacter sp. H2]|uniref:hypothetical protein n=1 Tax=Pseudarthrobacter sp. H2 TaxID=3418415 RepID=UPI003CE69AFA
MKNLKNVLNVQVNGHASSRPGGQLGVTTHNETQSLADIATAGHGAGRINSAPEAEALTSKCAPRGELLEPVIKAFGDTRIQLPSQMAPN